MIKQGINSNGEPIRSAFVEHDPVKFASADDGMTRQEFAAECDINTLMARYERTGILPTRAGEPQYLDLTEMPDNLMGALAMMDAANRSFMELPAHVRKEFDNDPVQFVEYCSNPDNLPRLAEWGLARPVEPAGAISPPAPSSDPSPPLPLPGGSDKPPKGGGSA